MAEWLDLRKVPLSEAQQIINRTFMFYGVQDVTALVDDQQTANGLARLIENREFTVEIGEHGGDYYLNVHKTTFVKPQMSKDTGYVLMIGSTSMGRGDDELGRRLLNGFLEGLAQVDNQPNQIVLLNEAVLMVAKTSTFLAPLKQLAAMGCDILVSSESADQYGVTAELALGFTVNSLHIAELVSQASRVVMI